MDQGYQPDSANMPYHVEAPRGYQNELLERAKKENIIAFVETGSGKTLIALYLIRHVLSQPSLEKKTAVFVVDRVVLAWQQSDYLCKGLEGEGYSVGVYYGDLGIDNWSGERWLHELAEKRVLVMTAQVFLNALRHGVLDMNTVAILVFDEAHHATGQHPFRRIMMEFYHTLPADVVKPRVFGMTASPVKTKSSTRTKTECGEAIAMLQVTMDAVVVSVSEDAQKELESLIPSAAEYVLEYETQENSQFEAEEESQVDELAIASGLDFALQSVLSSASARNGSSPNGFSVQGRSEHSLKANPPAQQLTQILQKMHSMLGARVSTYLGDQFRNGRQLSNDTVNLSDIQYGGDVITEKVSTLLKLLVSERLRWVNQSNGSDDNDSCFRCIVFVQERVAAFALAWLINDILGRLALKCLTARAVIGCSHRSTHLRMSKAQQDEILKGFRRGSYGILVATNVVEEGLDIPACGLVVSFDPITSTKAYVQSRGRARHEGSRYIILIPKGSEEHKLALAKVYEGIGVTRSVVQTFNAGELNSERWKAELEAQAKKIHDEEYVNVLCSRTTSARVFASSVLNLIKVYCLGLSCDRSEPTFTDTPDGDLFYATIKLPDPSPVRSASSSSPQTTIIMARRMAGLAAYKKLYECGEVDEYLLPKIRRRQASESNEAQEPRRGRYRRPRGDRASTRIRDCSIRQPVALLRRSAVARYNGELGFEEPHKIHLYRIIPHLRQHPLASQEYWPGCSTYGIGLENKLLEEDLEAFLCPTGERLLTLEYLGDVPWSAEKDTLCRRYMAAIRGCSVGHYPEWLFDAMITELPVVDTLPETTRGYTGTSNGAHEAHYSSDSASEDENCNSIPLSMKGQEEQVIALDYGGPLKEGNNETNGCREYEKQKGVPGFYFLPLAKDRRGFQSISTVDWRQVEELSAFSLADGPGKHLSSELEHQFVISSHEISKRIYFTGNVLDGVTPSTAAHPLLARKYRTIRGYYNSRHGIDLSDDQASFLEGFSVSKLFNGQRKHKFPLCSSFLFRIPLSPWAVFISSLLPGWQVYITLRYAWRKICPNRSIKFLSFTRAVQPNTGSLARDFPNLNYERAEFLGDAVLKLVSSMMAYATAPSDDEGLMTDARDEEVSNDKLCDIAVSIGIPRCIAFTSVTRNVKKWPWYWAAPQFAKISISEKVLADCIEALIGSHYLEGGVSSAIRFMNTYGIVKNAQVLLNFQYNPREGVPESRADLMRLTDPRLAIIEGTINYRFESKSILVEALTHGSYRSGNARSYQRLEFLGDAVVGFVLLSRFYEEFPSFSPGELSAMREPALSNEIFARVVVDHELHRSLWFDCRALDRDIRIFAELLKDEKEGEDVCKTLTVPKVLGDILEALVGAVVVDQRMHLEAVEDVVFLLMESVLERFVNPANLTGNPVSKLSRLVQGACGETPRFEYHEFTANSANGTINTPDYGRPMRYGMPFAARHVEETVAKCLVFVKGKEIASGTGPNRRVAKHRASHNALQTGALDMLLNHQAEENCNSSS